MDSYLLEYRFAGYPKTYLQEKYKKVHFGSLVGYRKHHFVPHITIAGPIKALSEIRLIKRIEEIIYNYSNYIQEVGHLVKSGDYMFFTTLDGRNAIAIKINPPKPLQEMKQKLEKVTNRGLFNKCTTFNEELWHSTLLLARKDNSRDNEAIKRIWLRVKHENPQQMQFILDRITLMKNKVILKEFDLVNRVTLSREEALDEDKRYKSYLWIKNQLQNKGENFRPSKNG